MNLDAIRSHWTALQNTTGIGRIHDDDDYSRMVELADALIDSGLACDDGELSELFAWVSGLISDYDETHHTLPLASPVDMLRFFMEQHGLNQSDLPEIGSQGVVSEILAGRRMLNTRQITALVARFGVSADVFIAPPSGVTH